MDIVDRITTRCKEYVFPSVQGRLTNQISEMIYPQLKDLPITNDLEKQLLVDAVCNRFDDATVKEHEPVGVNAALTTGEQLTQSSLSSHHHAGQKRGATGFERIEEITNMKDVTTMKVILKSIDGIPRSSEEVYRIATNMVGKTIHDLMDKKRKYKVLSVDDMEIKITSAQVMHKVYGTLDPYIIRSKAKESDQSIRSVAKDIKVSPNDIINGERGTPSTPILDTIYKYYPIWYKYVSAIPYTNRYGLPDTITPDSIKYNFLRIYLDPDQIYRSRIKLSTIADILRQSDKHHVAVLYPPIGEGLYIDIHSIGAKQTKTALYDILGSILETYVSGIPTVDNAFPISENLLTDTKIMEETSKDGYHIYRIASGVPNFIPADAWKWMITSMIPDAASVDDNWLRFKTTYDNRDVQRMVFDCPLMYADIVRDRITRTDGKIYITFRYELMNTYPYLEYADLRPCTFESESDADNFLLGYIVDHHLYWYIEGNCTQISEIYLMDEVDPRYTFTYGPSDSTATIGYLATRKIVYQEFRDNIKIDPSHLKLITNNMMLYEHPVAITRAAIAYDKTDWLTYSTYEDVMKYILQAAFVGSVDTCTSISAKVLTGQKITIGRGGDNLPPLENPFISMLKRDQERRK